MYKIEIDFQKLISFNLSVHQFLILRSIYYKDYKLITKLLSKEDCIDMRNDLYFSTSFILSNCDSLFTETIIDIPLVEKLLGIEKINFSEWYQIYPIKVGSRSLRAVSDSSEQYKKHQSKYLKRIKTIEQHQKAIKATESFVASQKYANKLQFLPNIETVLNNSLWENWTVFVEKSGEESSNWNDINI